MAAFVAAGIAVYRTKLIPAAAPAPWWAGAWRSEGGKPMPALDLALTAKGKVAGQLVSDSNANGYLISQAVIGGEEAPNGESLLIAVERGPAGVVPDQFGVFHAPPTYLLVQRGEGVAELYLLTEPSVGQARVLRPEGPTTRPIMFPTDLDKHHTKIAALVKLEAKAKP
jgi:hypothetical protein